MRRPLGLFVFGTLVTLAATAGMMISFQLAYLNWEFSQRTIQVSGTIDKLEQVQNGHSTVSMVSYQYEYLGKRVLIPNATVGPTTWSRLHLGSVVPVILLPDATHASRIDLPGEEEWHRRSARIGIITSTIFLAIGLFIALGFKPKPRATIPISEAVARVKEGWKTRNQ
jgi:hypothetical protein